MTKIAGAENAQELPFSIMILCAVGTVVRLKYESHVYYHRVSTAAKLIEFLGRVNSAAGKTLIATEIKQFSGDVFNGLELICK